VKLKERVAQILAETPPEMADDMAIQILTEIEGQPLDAAIDLRDVAWLLAVFILAAKAPKVYTRVMDDTIALTDGVC
jgi:hypothetical protein